MTTIVHLTSPAQFGGLERVVSGLCRETVARGHRVVLIATLSPGDPVPPWAEALREAGVVVEPLHLSSRAYARERRTVRGLLRRHGAQVVHTHGYRPDALHVGMVKSLGLPIVSTAHGFSATRFKGKVYEWFQKRAWRRFDAVVAVSQPLVEAIARAGVPRERIVLIRNGLSQGASAAVTRGEARARLGLPEATAVLGWVGRLSEEKDPQLAIEAFALLAAGSARLCMIGAGPQAEECRAQVARLGLGDRVTLAGAVPDAGPLLSAFDALVLSSRTEGTPMVILEAAAAGVAVVSTAVGGVPDLLGDDAGWLVPAGDAEALASAMGAALGDGAERIRRAERLRARLATDAGSDWVEQYLELYRRLRTE